MILQSWVRFTARHEPNATVLVLSLLLYNKTRSRAEYTNITYQREDDCFAKGVAKGCLIKESHSDKQGESLLEDWLSS